MPINQTISHKPARRQAKAAILAAAATAALGLAAIPAAASAASPSTTLTGAPTAYEQQLRNLNLPIGTGNVHTIAVNTPLPAGHYLVNAALDIANIPPGAVVLCGLGIAPNVSGDALAHNYGQVDNAGSAPIGGNCVTTGAVILNAATGNSVFAWAAVYSGPGGAVVGDLSMNELRVGTLTITAP
jgi:hypothetical protein